MFSSLEEKDRVIVINRCYWPLLRLVERGYKVGIELTGHTLELIDAIDSSWINKFKLLLTEGKVELIGSGYSQIIGPLVPAEVNGWNQKLGLKIYKKILDTLPKIALVNEMAYSAGIIEHYINNGYEAVIMEWNNPRKYHPEWDNQYRYYSQKVINQQGSHISLIWADSIAFQKFQRYAHGELSIEEYLNFLKLHKSTDVRYYPLYASDAEVFDFRPARFKTEGNQSEGESEWDRIELLIKMVKDEKDFQFVFPSEVIDDYVSEYSQKELSLETSEHPIPVKKQVKYNITRWALTGRNDLWLNTLCYRIFSNSLQVKDENYWRKLCYFWSSDFRTHIANGRWKHLLSEIENYPLANEQNISTMTKSTEIHFSQEHKFKTLSVPNLDVVLNMSKGCAIHGYKVLGENRSLFGTLEHGYFDDIEFGVDYFSGHTIIEQFGKHKITDISANEMQLYQNESSSQVLVETQSEDVRIKKMISVDSKNELLNISTKISFSSKKKEIVHPFHFTLIPEAWDESTLYYATHNGGNELERYKINNQEFNHSDNHSFLITSKHGLGNTKGIFMIGDQDKELIFKTDPKKSQIIPSVYYKKLTRSKYLFRLVYSAQEVDETSRVDENNYSIHASISVKYSNN